MEELPAQDVIEQANECWRGGLVRFTPHCRERMAGRSVEETDIASALETGALAESRWDDDYEEWRYRILGQDGEGENFSVVVAFEGDVLIVIITVY